MTDIVKKVQNTIREHSLIAEDEAVLVALSGGADSVCLLHILCRLGFRVAAAHLNHGLRGEEADRDEDFSRRMAENLGCRFFYRHADVKGYALEHKISEETAGRILRYDLFREIMSAEGITKTATAHHKNDNAETITKNFIHGGAAAGLSGIPYIRGGNIIRPLLDCTRADIEQYCRQNNLEYMTDKTNFSDCYTRNRIRLELIPAIEKYNPAFIDTVTKNARILADENSYLEELAAKAHRDMITDKGMELTAFNREHISIKRRIVRQEIAEIGLDGVGFEHIEAVIDLAQNAQSGTRADLPGGMRAEISFGRLRIYKKTAEREDVYREISLTEPVVDIPEMGIRLIVGEGEDFCFPAGATLAVRSRRTGDIFYPVGMKGRKKVKELLIEKKVPSGERSRVPILECDGEIAWIMGLRRDRRFVGKGVKLRFVKTNENME